MDLARRQLLLVEDNPGDARLIREFLHELPHLEYQLEWVDTLARGLASLSAGDVDAILLDLSLPDSQGIETFSAVHDYAPTVPIVVLSGSIDEEIALTAVHQGAQDYLVKGKVDGYLLARSIRYAIERKLIEETQRFFAEASRLLASSLDLEVTLETVARLVVPLLSDCCIVDLVDENQQLRQSAIAHRDPGQEEALRAHRQRYPFDVSRHVALAFALQTGQAMIYRDIADARASITASTGEQLAAEREFGFRSAMFVPLLARGRTLGVVCFFNGESERCFEEPDLTRATDLAQRATLAIDNAQLYRQSTEAIRLRDTVLSSVSHDLRNPLAAIRLIAETVRLQVSLDPPREAAAIQEGLERIESNTQRMASQIDELLDVARLQTGERIRLTVRSTDLVALAREAIRDYQQRTGRHQIRLDTTVPIVQGRWDRARLERVVGNLLSNAIKYSLAGGEIIVRIWIEESDETRWATLAVQDSGVGIPAADLPRVFTWFYRGDNVANEVAGAGIGLAGARQIVELHGGTIQVASQEGSGSTLTVRLPLPPVLDDAPERSS